MGHHFVDEFIPQNLVPFMDSLDLRILNPDNKQLLQKEFAPS